MCPCLDSCADGSTGKGDLMFCLKPLFVNPEESILLSKHKSSGFSEPDGAPTGHNLTQNYSADTSNLECTTQSILRLLPSNTSPPMPPGQQLTQA